MKSILIATFTLIASLPALAHMEIGFHYGKTPEGQSCFMQVSEVFFENNLQHPLNERVRLRIGADEFVVRHPPIIDGAQSMAFFNHDLFEGILATSTGGRAVIIEMIHEARKEGPRSFQVIDHQWKNNQRRSFKCLNLQFKR